jgi:glycogen debranching enzyme
MCESFHGVRIDNCHSTPLHVGQYMMDAGRSVRSNLIVVAELFTNSKEQDAIYTNVLGISCLVGEVSAFDMHSPTEQKLTPSPTGHDTLQHKGL